MGFVTPRNMKKSVVKFAGGACSAKVWTKNSELVKEVPHRTCVPDIAANDVKKAMEQAKKRAREETDMSILQVNVFYFISLLAILNFFYQS